MKNTFLLFGLSFYVIFFLAACAKPVAKFTVASKGELTATVPIQFQNNSKKADSYYWDFGDGQNSSEEAPNHQYWSSGNYLVKLIAKRNDKVSVDSQLVQIIGPVACLIEINTKYGKMVLELSDKTPKHRDNFIKLVEDGFYNDLLFHRVIDGFMIQGGDPNSKNAEKGQPLGSGGPGYQIPAEFTQDLAHVKGALAAARTGDAVNPERKSSGSQFYIVTGRPVSEADLDKMEIRKNIKYSASLRQEYVEKGGVPFLDADYTVFGKIVEGLDVIDQIAKAKTDGRDRPVEDVKMEVKLIK